MHLIALWRLVRCATSNDNARTIKFDLDFTDQLHVDLKRAVTQLPESSIQKLFDEQVSLCMYLKTSSLLGKAPVHVQVVDTFSRSVIFDKTFKQVAGDPVYNAHKITHELIPALTGQQGITLSTLAYCKQYATRHKVICVSDYSCKKEHVLVKANTLNVAPAWHTKAPNLFFSQFTNVNSRLMSINVHSKKQQVICSYDGLNMQPSFSPDGLQVALCMSGHSGNSELYLYDQRLCSSLKQRVFKQLTKNHGSNSSPCLLPNGDVVFCSDFQTGYPQLYYLDTATKKTTRLTNGRGYCAAPSYHPQNNALVYTRFAGGNFQLFTLSLADDQAKERQLTFSRGDKVDPSWSPCGRYIAFTYDYKNKKNW